MSSTFIAGMDSAPLKTEQYGNLNVKVFKTHHSLNKWFIYRRRWHNSHLLLFLVTLSHSFLEKKPPTRCFPIYLNNWNHTVCTLYHAPSLYLPSSALIGWCYKHVFWLAEQLAVWKQVETFRSLVFINLFLKIYNIVNTK